MLKAKGHMPQCPTAGDMHHWTSYCHGRRSRGERGEQVPPPEFGMKDGKANCLPPILSYRYKKERSVAFKILQNPFSAGALTGTPLGRSSCTMSPGSPIVGWEGTSLPYLPIRYQPTFGARHASPRIPARSTPMVTACLISQSSSSSSLFA